MLGLPPYNTLPLSFLKTFTSQFGQGVIISLGISANYAPENKQLTNLKTFWKDLKAQQTTSNGLLLLANQDLWAKLRLTVYYTACQNEFCIF